MYSASVVERAVSVCSLDAQVARHSAYVMAHPERHLDVVGSVPAIFFDQILLQNRRQPNIHSFYQLLDYR